MYPRVTNNPGPEPNSHRAFPANAGNKVRQGPISFPAREPELAVTHQANAFKSRQGLEKIGQRIQSAVRQSWRTVDADGSKMEYFKVWQVWNLPQFGSSDVDRAVRYREFAKFWQA